MPSRESRPMRETHPDLAKDFHPDRNGNLSPDSLVAGTGKRLWWRCQHCSNEWKDTGNNRVRGRDCSYCSNGRLHSDGRNSLAALKPEIARELHPEKNEEINPWKISLGSNKYANWVCYECENEWRSPIIKRGIRGDGCSYCSRGKLHSDGRNSLANSRLMKDFNFEKNEGINPSNLTIRTNKSVDWKCRDCGHEWNTSPRNRYNRGKFSGCGVCNAGRIHSDGMNSLSNLYPDIFAELHPLRNKNRNLENITVGSSDRVWWKCDKCHNEWKSPIRARAMDNDGCGYCNAGRLHSDKRNSLLSKRPDLSEEFDLKLNYPLTPDDITYASSTYVHWRCNTCSHNWKQSPKTRVRMQTNCPICAEGGIDYSKSGHYYVIRINVENETILWKGGISSNYKRRFRNHVGNFNSHERSKSWNLTLVETFPFERLIDAKNLEDKLLEQEIKAPNIPGLSSELFLSNPLDWAREIGWL